MLRLKLFFVALLALLLLATGGAASHAAAPAADGLPTQQQVRDAYAAGQYPQVLLMTARQYDRRELLTLKAESHLRGKPAAAVAAAQAFAEAAKAATDGPSVARAMAAELLVRRAGPALTYQPKRKDPQDKTRLLPPVDVVDPASRKAAFEHLYADELAAAEPKVRAARDAKTLGPVLEALPLLRNLRWLEVAATGQDAKAREVGAGLLSKAQGWVDSGLKEMADATEATLRASNEVLSVRTAVVAAHDNRVKKYVDKFRRRGPTDREFAALRTAVTTCGKIHESCDDLGRTLGTTGKEFDAAKGKAQVVGSRARRIGEINWKEMFDRPPAPLQ